MQKIGSNSEPFWQFNWEQVGVISSVDLVVLVVITEEHRPQRVGPKKSNKLDSIH